MKSSSLGQPVSQTLQEMSLATYKSDWRDKTYNMLYLIPGAENKVTFEELSASLNGLYDNKEATEAYLYGILNFLKLFGVIEIRKDRDTLVINAMSEAGQCFIKSLAEHLKNDIKIVGDWHRLGSHNDIPMSKILPFGAQFLRLLETNRIEKSPIPIRNAKVAVKLFQLFRFEILIT